MNWQAGLGDNLAIAAASLIGTPFRLYGRDPARGVDCIGLIHVCLLKIGRKPLVPAGYKLRNSKPEQWFDFARQSGFVDTSESPLPGDVLVTEPGPGQQHIELIETPGTIIHAHAGLGKVVRQRIDCTRPYLAHWRLSEN